MTLSPGLIGTRAGRAGTDCPANAGWGVRW